MKIVRFVVFFIITIVLFIFLNNPFQGGPPLGKFLSPHEGYLQNAEASDISLPASLRLKGLKESVKVQFDEIYIPHIYAKNDEDLHFAQGYITAYHRLWQMDFYNRLVFGRLSEVLGERALDFDRGNRRIGLKSMTVDFHAKLMNDPQMKIITEAYTAGVNAYIDQLRPADYPLEFKLLNYKPEKWTTLKTCTAYGLLANTLSKGEADLQNTNAISIFGEELFNVLFPEAPGYDEIDPVFPKGTLWDFDPIEVEKPEGDFPIALTKNTLERPDRIFGSNNFTVSGRKSKSGNAILANEPDLQLTSPSIWYAAHLNSPTTNVMGVTVPGTLAVLIGFNDSIAWGVTNSPRDQVDWYSIEFKDASRKEYWYNNQWFKTESVVEKFKVLNGEDFYDTIINVHHGPVVYDRNFLGDGDKVNYAMRWLAHRDNDTYRAMYGLNKGKNINDFHAAMKQFTGPPQNVLFADTKGNIALRAPGKFPVKWPGQGKFLMNGSDPDYEWKSLIPYEHEMAVINPEQGFLSSANQHQVDSTYPYYVYDDHFEYYRNRRINDRLKVVSNITASDMIKLQNDNFNYIASEILPVMLDSLDTLDFTETSWEYYNTLREWDYFAQAELEAPTLFDIWWDKLFEIIWDEFDTIEVSINKPNTYTTIDLLKNRPDLTFFDVMATTEVEDPNRLYKISFTNSLDSLAKWKEAYGENYSWYLFKNTRINHLLRLEPFNRTQIPIGGDQNIVNAAGKTAGPSWRMVVELDPTGIRALGVYPGSQSGNPGNPTYGHMIDNWANSNYYELLFKSELTADEATHELNLNP